jgi:choline dehydrogenase-like flavoprotein
MAERIECAVIGAGVVGLAIARRLAAAGREVVILEADLRPLRHDELAALEPEVRCVAGLLSPSTGIVDSHGLMLEYLGDAEICLRPSAGVLSITVRTAQKDHVTRALVLPACARVAGRHAARRR